jgi:2-polyprenyl-3-methyl-5-hydroxy-6-metoxy-1,4-benzoquinol methylase
MAFIFEAIEQATDWDHYAFLAVVGRDKKLHSLLSQGCRLLDVGCGTSSLVTKLHDTYPRSSLVGIDPSEEAMRRAKKMLENRPVQIMKMEGEAMRFLKVSLTSPVLVSRFTQQKTSKR